MISLRGMYIINGHYQSLNADLKSVPGRTAHTIALEHLVREGLAWFVDGKVTLIYAGLTEDFTVDVNHEGGYALLDEDGVEQTPRVSE